MKTDVHSVGFTLIELMVTISIAGLMLSMAVPSFTDALRNNRLTTYANDFLSSLSLARSEAIKRGVSVTVRKSGAQWEGGWAVFIDDNSNGQLNSNELIIQSHAALPATFTLRGNSNFTNFVRYVSSGASSTTGSFMLCDNKDNNDLAEPYTSRLLIINNVGRIRMAEDTNNNGLYEKSANDEVTTCVSGF